METRLPNLCSFLGRFIDASSFATCASKSSPPSASSLSFALSRSWSSSVATSGQISEATWAVTVSAHSLRWRGSTDRLEYLVNLSDRLFLFSFHTGNPDSWSIHDRFCPDRGSVLKQAVSKEHSGGISLSRPLSDIDEFYLCHPHCFSFS